KAKDFSTEPTISARPARKPRGCVKGGAERPPCRGTRDTWLEFLASFTSPWVSHQRPCPAPPRHRPPTPPAGTACRHRLPAPPADTSPTGPAHAGCPAPPPPLPPAPTRRGATRRVTDATRSEERRVGTEGRSRLCAWHCTHSTPRSAALHMQR